MTDDDLIQTAKQLVGEFKTSDDCVAGGVAAALISASGHVYTGVCVDTACSLGFCAEHAAIAEMLKARESEIDTIVAVCGSGIVPPCGRCRELIRQINATNIRTRVIIGPRRVVTLPELLPFRFAADGRSDREPARVTRSVGRRGFVNEWVFVDVPERRTRTSSINLLSCPSTHFVNMLPIGCQRLTPLGKRSESPWSRIDGV